MKSRRIIVGVSGASGVQLAINFLRNLRKSFDPEVHLIVTKAAVRTLELESSYTISDLTDLADVTHNRGDVAATVASGSFVTRGMVIVPCSMKTLGGIAGGCGEGLIPRAADVCLKENRPLVVVPRESPLSLIHLENLVRLKRAGATILPPMLEFYTRPSSLEDVMTHVSGRILDAIGIEHDCFTRWTGPGSPGQRWNDNNEHAHA